MANTLTRAEAICACQNIKEQIDENEKIPDAMGTGIHIKCEGMGKYMREQMTFPNVTDKMDTAIYNMWGGVRKWDRNNEYSDNMLEGLNEVTDELDTAQAARPVKGREESPPDVRGTGAGATGATGDAKPTTRAYNKEDLAAQDAILRSKEVVIHEAMQALDKVGIKDLQLALRGFTSDLTDILRKTTSIRTKKLIEAAFHSGKMSGVRQLCAISFDER
jgi:hypothetical protein